MNGAGNDFERTHLETVLASRTFADSPRLRAFLKYIGELALDGRCDAIKEIAIGFDVFERGPEFDPKTDPIVRVQAGRLRNKLRDYYEREASTGDSIRIELPKGTYVPAFRSLSSFAEASALEHTPFAAGEAVTAAPERQSKPIGKAVASVAVTGILAVCLYFWFRPEQPLSLTGLKKITNGERKIPWISLSPDGSLLAFSAVRKDSSDDLMLIRHMDSGSEVVLPGDAQYARHAGFSPDGSKIAYCLHKRPGQSAPFAAVPGLYAMPTLGGPATLIREGGCWPRYSPDGKWIAYSLENNTRIAVTPSEGGKERTLAPDFARTFSPTWADDRNILFMGWKDATKPRNEEVDWWVGSIDGAPPVRTGAYAHLLKTVFDKERSNLVSAWSWYRNHGLFSFWKGGSRNVWALPISPQTWKVAGNARQLTSGSGDEGLPLTSLKGKLVFGQVRRSDPMYLAPLQETKAPSGRGLQLNDTSEAHCQPSVSDDGNLLAYVTQGSNYWTIRIHDLRTGQDRPIYQVKQASLWAVISPDGRNVAFQESLSPLGSGDSLKVVPVEGGGASRTLCNDCGKPTSWTRDGSAITMHAGAMTRQDHVTLVDAKTGARSEVLRIPKKRVRPQGFAPDGRWLTLVVEDDHHPVTFVAPFSNGRTGPEASWIKVRDGNADAVWTADGNGLVAPAATDGHSACLWLFHLDPLTRRPTGQQTPLLHLHDDTANLSNLALQRYLAVTRNSIIYALPVLASDLWEGQLR